MSLVLSELTELEQRFGEKAVDELRRAANLLLRRQFLFAGDRGATHAYEQIVSARFRNYFVALFDALGYVLRVNETEQWVGVLPDPELDAFPRMRAEHTIVLLILALAWQEAVNRGGAETRAVVTTTLNDLFERYRDVAGRSRKEALTTARLEEGLREFERRGLVAVGPLDPDAADKQVEIRPMVHLLVDGNALDRLERFAVEAETTLSRRRVQEDAEGLDEDLEGEEVEA